MGKGQLLSQGLASMNFVTSVKFLHHKMPPLLPLLNRGSSTHYNPHWELVRTNPWISWKWEWWEQLKDNVKPQAFTCQHIPKDLLSCSADLLRATASLHSLPCTVLLLGSSTPYHIPLMEVWLPGATAELGFSSDWAVHSRQQTQIKVPQQNKQTWIWWQQQCGVVPKEGNRKVKTGGKS